MSATYRIETSYEPNGPDDPIPWIARAYRLSDGEYVTHAWAADSVQAECKARVWVVNYEGNMRPTITAYVDDQGRNAEAPQSVKV